MSSFIYKLVNPGIVPQLKAKIYQLPLPSFVKNICDHPAGPLTIHFWAPTFKWGISIANIADLDRPIEKLSTAQQIAVAATGIIWSRYSMVIVPVNYNLLSVNIAMAVTGLYQLQRIFRAKYYNKESTENRS